ncbi:hypothetical protein GGI21_005956, partial [Coemansia aciculifera]
MPILSPDQIQFYRSHGYLIVDSFLTNTELQLYQADAQLLTNHCLEQGDIVTDWGCIVEPLACNYYDDDQLTNLHKATRADYLALRHSTTNGVALCTLDKFGLCARQLLHHQDTRETVFLLNEQYIAKPPRSTEAQFAWHQDILYMSETERQHAIVSVWTPLCDVGSDNGTVMVEPFPDPNNPGVYADKCQGAFTVVMDAGSALFMDG